MLLEKSLMNFFLRISKEIKWKGESGVTRCFIDDVHSSDIQGGQTEGESAANGSIIDELHNLGSPTRSNGK